MSDENRFEKTPEQIAQVKRLAMPIAVAGLVLGAAGLIMLLRGWVDTTRPPDLLGANLCFFAMMMGVGILAWAKGTPGAKPALLLSLVAVIFGVVGAFGYYKRGFDWRIQMEQRELNNVAAVAKAAMEMATRNGVFPKDIAAMRAAGLLSPEVLHSPYGSNEVSQYAKDLKQGKITQTQFDGWYRTHSDYEYFGKDLGNAQASTAPAGTNPRVLNPWIVIAAARNPVKRMKLAIAFVDGIPIFIDLEKAQGILKLSNDARKKAGLPEMRPPSAVERATSQERSGLK